MHLSEYKKIASKATFVYAELLFSDQDELNDVYQAKIINFVTKYAPHLANLKVSFFKSMRRLHGENEEYCNVFRMSFDAAKFTHKFDSRFSTYSIERRFYFMTVKNNNRITVIFCKDK